MWMCGDLEKSSRSQAGEGSGCEREPWRCRPQCRSRVALRCGQAAAGICCRKSPVMGWTSIYQLFWGSLGTRVLTHPHITIISLGCVHIGGTIYQITLVRWILQEGLGCTGYIFFILGGQVHWATSRDLSVKLQSANQKHLKVIPSNRFPEIS